MDSMYGCLLGLTALIVMHGGALGCRESLDYRNNCSEPFRQFEASSTFWQSICSLEGRGVFQCIYSQINDTSCFSYDQEVEDIFRGVFGSYKYNIDVACEVAFDASCREIFTCMTNFVNASVPTVPYVYQFWAFLCGPDFIQPLITCIEQKRPMCPATAAFQTSLFSITTSQGKLTYAEVSNTTRSACQALSDGDRQCIASQAAILDTCETKPQINNFKLSCDYTDGTPDCLTRICGTGVAQFFVEITSFLKCGRTVKVCPATSDMYGTWPLTLVGSTSTLPCQTTCYIGDIRRSCTSGGLWNSAQNLCFFDLTCPPVNVTNLDTLLEDVTGLLANGTIVSSETSPDPVSDFISDVVDVVEKNIGDGVVSDVFDNFLNLSNEYLSPRYQSVLKKEGNQDSSGVKVFLSDLDRFLSVQLEQETIVSRITPNTVVQKNRDYLTVQIGRTTGSIVFPDLSGSTAALPALNRARIEIDAKSLKGLSQNGSVLFAGTYFTGAINNLDSKVIVNGSFETSLAINSDIISLQVKDQSQGFDPPVKLTFTILKKNYKKPVCVFLNHSITHNGTNGTWSTDGCSLISNVNNTVRCECNHLTNFAVLMSPSPDIGLIPVLNIISAVGCGVSIVCLFITIIVHLIVWRLVRSDRSIILMNLCVALILALSIFLAGINRVESKPVCIAIAALIQFFFLALFFLMLVMGIEILVCVVHVFSTKFRIKIFVPLAWILAAVVVGVSLFLTKTEGYGNDKFCWLDVSSGLIWAFIGPALFVILGNFIIIVIVLQKLATAKFLKMKSRKIQLKTAVRSLCVLLPLLGLTWIFGVLAVNKDLVWMAYTFSILNCLQGLFIFLMHCVFNKQIRDALKHRERRKRSLQSFSSNFRKQTRSTSADRSQSFSDSFPGMSERRGVINSSFTDENIRALRKAQLKATRRS